MCTLRDDKLPVMDQAMSALVEDLSQRGLLEDAAIIWLGEFGRTPRINGNGGRDHWAKSWSAVVGGAGFAGGRVIAPFSLGSFVFDGCRLGGREAAHASIGTRNSMLDVQSQRRSLM